VIFPAYRTDRQEPGPSVEMFRMLRAAGCDTTNEHDLQMGMIAYNVVLLACRRRHTNVKTVRPAEKSHTGRNEPCPCGSGKKYKKCCLDKNRAVSADSYPAASLKLEPEILPRLWDEGAVAEDCAILGRILDRDPAFAGLGFSMEKISSFMEMVVNEDPSFMDDDKEEIDRAIDDLAIRYARESGEGKILKGAKEKLLDAITRAQSKDEIRALATGICMGFMGDASDDTECNLLNVIFFRRAVVDAIQRTSLVSKVANQLGGDVEELRRLLTTNDPSANEKIEACLKGLTPLEIETIQVSYEKSCDELWNTISAGEFPVPMPFATQLALYGRFESATRSKKCSPEELYEVVEAFSDELIEEDYILYGQMLDRWLKDDKKRSGRIAKAVELMAGLCATRSIEDWVPNLLVRCGRRGLVVPFDEEERHFIYDHPKSFDDPEFVAEYVAWLDSKGYPGMANRLRVSWENLVSSESPDVYRPRKLSVG
jgi:SEC-C motif-containing protein